MKKKMVLTFTAILTLSLVVSETCLVGVRRAEAQPFTYVSNGLSNNVSVIDTKTNMVVAVVPVGSNPFNMAITPDGRFAWVANRDSQTISVIDTAKALTDPTHAVIGTVAVGPSTNDIAFTPDGAFAYVAVYGLNELWKLSTSPPYTVLKIFSLSQPIGVAVTPNGAFVYVTQYPSNVAVINTATDVKERDVPVGLNPINVPFTPDGQFAYVTNANANTVSVINTVTYTVTTVVTGSNPLDIAITPDGRCAYVTLNDGGAVQVIDTDKKMVVATVNDPLGVFTKNGPVQLGIAPDGTAAYVAAQNQDKVAVVKTDTVTCGGVVVATVSVGHNPQGTAITPPIPAVTHFFNDFRYEGTSGLFSERWWTEPGCSTPTENFSAVDCSKEQQQHFAMNNVIFDLDVSDPADTGRLLLRAHTDGTPTEKTSSARIETVLPDFAFRLGTYVARVKFDNKFEKHPVFIGGRRVPGVRVPYEDKTVQTFFTVRPAPAGLPELYSELDFEYRWDWTGPLRSFDPSLDFVSWESVSPRDRVFTPLPGEFKGWHYLVLTVSETRVTYEVFRRQGAGFQRISQPVEHPQAYVPEQPMVISFAHWFSGIDPWRPPSDRAATRVYDLKIDWVYYEQATLTVGTVDDTVAALRAANCYRWPEPRPEASCTWTPPSR